MNAMSPSQWIFAATLVVAAVLISIALARLIRSDGYHARTTLNPRSDWGTPTRPSRPHNARL